MDGHFYSWGRDDCGQLGSGKFGRRYDDYAPVLRINWPADIVDIKCGEFHTLALTSTQEVYSCGDASKNQLGRKSPFSMKPFSPKLQKIDNFPDIIRIECGANHSICMDINYDIYVFGATQNGQLGVSSFSPNSDNYHCMANILPESVSEPIKHPSLSNIIDISKGGNHTFIKTSNNEICFWK